MSVKCRLLGWWTDEAKGYRLKEVEIGKLIAARDVFVEDDTPADLAVIETRGVAPAKAESDNLVPGERVGEISNSPATQPRTQSPVNDPVPDQHPSATTFSKQRT